MLLSLPQQQQCENLNLVDILLGFRKNLIKELRLNKLISLFFFVFRMSKNEFMPEMNLIK